MPNENEFATNQGLTDNCRPPLNITVNPRIIVSNLKFVGGPIKLDVQAM